MLEEIEEEKNRKSRKNLLR